MGKRRRNTELLEKIATKVRKLREERNISQDNMEEDTGINISRIEAARVDISVSTLQALCDYFEISVVDFYSGIREPQQQ